MLLRVTATLLSLQATLSLASDLPSAVTPADFPPTDPLLVDIGRDLFFDPILSGNRNIACATCHHPSLASADGMSLGLGEGAVALGDKRHVVEGVAMSARIPRNAPALFNLGAYEFTVMFHDGRVQANPAADFGFQMPAHAALERPVPSALAAQAHMPPTSHDEMAGQGEENDVSVAAGQKKFGGDGGVWDLLCKRVEAIPGYADRFRQVIGPDRDLHFTDIARAIAEFETFEFQSINSPFDRYLQGEADALTDDQMAGMDLFYGAGNCATCHAGKFQTDHSFHAIGLPQFGPGKEDGGYADRGRLAVTGAEDDRYRFRTPSLRNVAVTAPYGHNGAYTDLEMMVRHHLDPVAALTRYDRAQARLPEAGITDDWAAMDDIEEVIRIAEATEIMPVTLSETEIAQLIAFLHALTDPEARTGRLGPPQSVPSGLPLDPVN